MSSFTQSYFFFHFYVFLYTDPIHFHAYFSQFSWKELLGQQQQHERHEWMFSTAQSSPKWFIYILGWTVLTRCSGHGRLRECMDNDCWSWWMMTVHALCLLKDMPSYVRTPCNQLWLCHQTPFKAASAGPGQFQLDLQSCSPPTHTGHTAIPKGTIRRSGRNAKDFPTNGSNISTACSVYRRYVLCV